MEFAAMRGLGTEILKKYRFVLFVLLAGILLMTLPREENPKSEVPQTRIKEQLPLQESLAEILELIEGAGKVEVLLTEKTGTMTLYQTDEDYGAEDTHLDTVLITGTDRVETGLIRQVNPPTYQGAIILCQGADSAYVRLSVVEAVMSVTGLTSDSITVLKMK